MWKKEARFLLKFWIRSGAKEWKSCRYRKMLKNAPTLAIGGVHTEENEHCKVCPLSVYRSPRCSIRIFHWSISRKQGDNRNISKIKNQMDREGKGRTKPEWIIKHILSQWNFEIYKIVTPSHRSESKISAKTCQKFSIFLQIFCKILLNFYQNLAKFQRKFTRISLRGKCHIPC